MIVQDYRQAIERSTVPTRDQSFFLCGQMCDFLHRLLRRILPRSCLPDEWDWDALRSFDFAIGELLGIPEFMQKMEFRAKVLKVPRSTRKWHSESADPAKALGPSDILDRNPVVDLSDR